MVGLFIRARIIIAICKPLSKEKFTIIHFFFVSFPKRWAIPPLETAISPLKKVDFLVVFEGKVPLKLSVFCSRKEQLKCFVAL